MSDQRQAFDSIIVGGGLGGLTTAAYLARAGRSVLVLERSECSGGRAQTHRAGEFLFNIGPHALYNGAAGMRALRELGVPFSGKPPAAVGGLAVRGGALDLLPGGPMSLLRTRLLPFGAKMEVARLLGSLAKIDAAAADGVTVRDWLAREVRHDETRALLGALFRLVSYADETERSSAGAVLASLRTALTKNVVYLDGGWQSLVDGLRKVAEDAGAKIVTGAGAESVERAGGLESGPTVWRVRVADGAVHEASHVVIAASPAVAAGLVGDAATALGEWTHACTPIQAASLDVALTRLPEPKRLFALGIDAPTYFSVHSAYGKLAPAGGATLHVMKYLAPDREHNAREVEGELTALLELVQPGWREGLVEKRFLPAMTVTHALITAEQGGLAGRPGPEVPGARGLYVVGDWVGAEGMLADASFASAKRAAEMIVEDAQS